MATYNEGDLIKVTGTFTNLAGTAVDPTAVTAYYRSPAGTTTTLVYGTDAALVKQATGIYTVDISAAEPGWWYYAFRATGTGQSAGESRFRVTPSRFF